MTRGAGTHPARPLGPEVPGDGMPRAASAPRGRPATLLRHNTPSQATSPPRDLPRGDRPAGPSPAIAIRLNSAKSDKIGTSRISFIFFLTRPSGGSYLVSPRHDSVHHKPRARPNREDRSRRRRGIVPTAGPGVEPDDRPLRRGDAASGLADHAPAPRRPARSATRGGRTPEKAPCSPTQDSVEAPRRRGPGASSGLAPGGRGRREQTKAVGQVSLDDGTGLTGEGSW